MLRRSLAVLATILMITVAAGAQSAPSVAGDWEGTLDLGAAKVRVVMHLTKEKEAWNGTLDSPDQGSFGIPLGEISFKEGVLKFEIPSIMGAYEGTSAKEGAVFKGEWKQGGRNLLLEFARVVMPLAAQERDFLVKHLQRTRKIFLDSIAGLSEAQWNFKAAQDRWSVAECAEHITLSEELIMGLAQQVAHMPITGPRLAKPNEMDQKIVAVMVDRSQKAQAPEQLKPSGRFPNRQAIEAAFTERRDKTLKYAESTQEDLRAHNSPHPLFKTTDAYQWLVILSAHSERHSAQINEVKADPKFPKK